MKTSILPLVLFSVAAPLCSGCNMPWQSKAATTTAAPAAAPATPAPAKPAPAAAPAVAPAPAATPVKPVVAPAAAPAPSPAVNSVTQTITVHGRPVTVTVFPKAGKGDDGMRDVLAAVAGELSPEALRLVARRAEVSARLRELEVACQEAQKARAAHGAGAEDADPVAALALVNRDLELLDRGKATIDQVKQRATEGFGKPASPTSKVEPAGPSRKPAEPEVGEAVVEPVPGETAFDLSAEPAGPDGGKTK
jgi:hypothetical protein